MTTRILTLSISTADVNIISDLEVLNSLTTHRDFSHLIPTVEILSPFHV